MYFAKVSFCWPTILQKMPRCLPIFSCQVSEWSNCLCLENSTLPCQILNYNLSILNSLREMPFFVKMLVISLLGIFHFNFVLLRCCLDDRALLKSSSWNLGLLSMAHCKFQEIICLRKIFQVGSYSWAWGQLGEGAGYLDEGGYLWVAE